MKRDKTLRSTITNIVTLVFVMFCLIGYILGWVDPSPLFCPSDSNLILHSRNEEISRGGIEQTHTVSSFDCVNVHGVSVQNNADMIFGLVCALPFFLLMFWGVVSSLFSKKKEQRFSSQKGDRKRNKNLLSKNHEFEEFFHFTPTDLEQNKKGFVSESQKKMLRLRSLENSFRTSIFPILVVLAILAFLRLKGGMMFLSALVPYLALVLIVIIGIIFFPVFKKMDYSLKSAQGKVNLVKVLKTTQDKERIGNEYLSRDPVRKTKVVMVTEMHIGAETFSVNEALFEVVHQGDMCRVYYIASGDIVSMEFLL